MRQYCAFVQLVKATHSARVGLTWVRRGADAFFKPSRLVNLFAIWVHATRLGVLERPGFLLAWRRRWRTSEVGGVFNLSNSVNLIAGGVVPGRRSIYTIKPGSSILYNLCRILRLVSDSATIVFLDRGTSSCLGSEVVLCLSASLTLSNLAMTWVT